MVLEESLPVAGIGMTFLSVERFPRGRVGSSRPILRRKIVQE
jgi:hypothetical protein